MSGRGLLPLQHPVGDEGGQPAGDEVALQARLRRIRSRPIAGTASAPRPRRRSGRRTRPARRSGPGSNGRTARTAVPAPRPRCRPRTGSPARRPARRGRRPICNASAPGTADRARSRRSAGCGRGAARRGSRTPCRRAASPSRAAVSRDSASEPQNRGPRRLISVRSPSRRDAAASRPGVGWLERYSRPGSTSAKLVQNVRNTAWSTRQAVAPGGTRARRTCVRSPRNAMRAAHLALALHQQLLDLADRLAPGSGPSGRSGCSS